MFPVQKLAVAALMLVVTACSTTETPTQSTDPLSSWNDGATKQAIVTFVEAVTTEGGPDQSRILPVRIVSGGGEVVGALAGVKVWMSRPMAAHAVPTAAAVSKCRQRNVPILRTCPLAHLWTLKRNAGVLGLILVDVPTGKRPLKHPFNEELTFVAERFGSLLREIVETIDKHGLKKFHLGKHKRSAEQFFTDVASLHCTTETGTALQKRIKKNREKLFTFPNHDGVPWNNNIAEHAVRAFTRLRNVMGTSTPTGTMDYLILLSLQQTLRCRGGSFLQFLRSGRVDP